MNEEMLDPELQPDPPSIRAARDATTGDWRFRIIGVDTGNPEAERYSVEIVGAGRITCAAKGESS